MTLIIVTGPIGAGKSTLVDLLQQRGAAVLRADEVVRALYADDPNLVVELEQAIGRTLRDARGEFAAGLLAQAVFSDPAVLAKVEALVHPKVRLAVIDWLGRQTSDLCVYEVPLWPEGADRFGADLVVQVAAPAKLRRERLLARGMTATDVDARLATQANQSAGKVDLVIANEGDESDLADQVDLILGQAGVR